MAVGDLGRTFGINEGYVAELLERYARDPSSVDPAVRRFLEARAVPPSATRDGTRAVGLDALRRAIALQSLVDAIRRDGHRAASIDPLGLRQPRSGHLQPEAHGLDEDDLEALPAELIDSPLAEKAENARSAVERLRAVYCGTTGYEFDHVGDPERRAWLHRAVESEEHAEGFDARVGRLLLERLTAVETFERFLHRNFPGSKWFSVEGNDMLVPLLDELLWLAAHAGMRAVGMGMAHRGRLNVLAHLLGKSYEQVLAEFEGGTYAHESTAESTVGPWMHDVKYHQGGSTTYEPLGTDEELAIQLFLCPNPSHLELVGPVVLGAVRARQEALVEEQPWLEPFDAAMPVLMHGDASFPGQGVVAEALNLARLPGYTTGGTVHVVINNQIGFTTEAPQLYSGPYATGPAHSLGMPIIHVNADDPMAVLAAARLAFAYRQRYHDDVLIDLVGYRRYGHNEGDEPSFTQPLMYEAIRSHPTVRELLAARLAAGGIVSADEAESMVTEAWTRLADALDRVRKEQSGSDNLPYASPMAPKEPIPLPNPVSEDLLRRLNEDLHRLPEGFRLHPKLARPFERRRRALEEGASVDWAHAEALAFATILTEGCSVRLSGQDTERGTFSQRHAVLHDVETGERFVPLASLPGEGNGAFTVLNSPLSEVAALAFEYGYSVEARRAIVLWEAQFGDFINNAQAVVDEFIASAEAKWGQRSGVVLLLPHGYEGQGPDHSNARLDRFLALAAEGNMRVAYPTTAAQYFHLLRWQAAIVQVAPDPMVVMTPKSLLRHPLAASSLDDLAGASFQPVMDDPNARRDPGRVRRVVLCTGKVFVDLVSSPAYAAGDVAVVRVEQLYPFPADELSEVLRRYPNAGPVVWAQEEPQNMGAWTYVAPLLAEAIGYTPRYAGRPRRASPAEGYAALHRLEQDRVVQEAFAGLPQTQPRR